MEQKLFGKFGIVKMNGLLTTGYVYIMGQTMQIAECRIIEFGVLENRMFSQFEYCRFKEI